MLLQRFIPRPYINLLITTTTTTMISWSSFSCLTTATHRRTKTSTTSIGLLLIVDITDLENFIHVNVYFSFSFYLYAIFEWIYKINKRKVFLDVIQFIHFFFFRLGDLLRPSWVWCVCVDRRSMQIVWKSKT